MEEAAGLRRSRLELLLDEAAGGKADGVFALFDAARLPGLPALLNELAIPADCLFRGALAEDVEQVAPYLAQLRFRSAHFEWLNRRTTDAASALFVVSDAPAPAVFTHLRRFLLVRAPDQRQLLFRFYDPRVIGPFLGSCTEIEKRQFFGPIQRLLVWDPKSLAYDPAAVLREWHAPPPSPEAVRYPDAYRLFQLRPEHEDACRKDALERYDERCIDYLRSTHAARVREATREELHAVVVRARESAPALGVVAGRDVTMLAEVMLAGLTPAIESEITAAPLDQRTNRLTAVRDRLFASEAT